MDGSKDRFARQCKWIRRNAAALGSSGPAVAEGIHKQARCINLANEWGNRWNPKNWTPPAPVDVRTYSDWTDNLDLSPTEISWDADLLCSAARSMRGKAAGTDGFSGTAFANLPSEAFEPMATWWSAAWEGAKEGRNLLPAQLCHVRMCFIPRQIGIAQVFWRVAMKSIIRQLGPWMQ